MKYKLSMFNYHLKYNNGEATNSYVFNSLSRKLVKVNEYNNSLIDSLDESLIQPLSKIGIIVEADCDEIEQLETIITQKKYEQRRLMMTIIPTNACNFRCIYCYQSENDCFMDESTKISLMKWLDKNLRFYNEMSLSWFGGEPLLCKDLILEILKEVKMLCKKHKVAMISSITTNGYLLNNDTFQKLVANGMLFYQITLDGNESIHNLQRPHKTESDSYTTIINNLEMISRLPRNIRFEVGLRINLSGLMERKEVYKFIDYIAQIFNTDKRFVIIWQWVRDWGGKRIQKYDVKKIVGESNACIAYMEYAKNKGLKNVDLISTTTGTDSCEAFFRNGYVINYDGNVYKCAMCIEDKKNNCIGYISKSGEMIIDLSKERKWLKREYIEEKCKKCIYLPMCIMNRCHYSSKIHGKTKCIEYKDLIESQIISMIVQHKYLDIYRR
jgi:uncharacterized protein